MRRPARPAPVATRPAALALAAALGAAACTRPPPPAPRRPPAPAPAPDDVALDVRVVSDEARAVLAIAAEVRAGREAPEAHWFGLFASEGYRRLKKREASLGREFADETFRAFVTSGATVARAPALEAALPQWERADPRRAARLALAYLPPGPAGRLRDGRGGRARVGPARPRRRRVRRGRPHGSLRPRRAAGRAPLVGRAARQAQGVGRPDRGPGASPRRAERRDVTRAPGPAAPRRAATRGRVAGGAPGRCDGRSTAAATGAGRLAAG